MTGATARAAARTGHIAIDHNNIDHNTREHVTP